MSVGADECEWLGVKVLMKVKVLGVLVLMNVNGWE
jgi:hypothetical protein